MEQQFGLIYHDIRGIQQELRDCQKNICSIHNDFKKIPSSSPKRFQKKKSSSQLNQNDIFNSKRNFCNLFQKYDNELDSQPLQFQIANYSQESPRRPLKQFQSKIQLNQELSKIKKQFSNEGKFEKPIIIHLKCRNYQSFSNNNSPTRKLKTFDSFKNQNLRNSVNFTNSNIQNSSPQKKLYKQFNRRNNYDSNCNINNSILIDDSRLSSSLFRQDSKQKLKQFSRSPQRLRASYSTKNKFNQNDYFNKETNQSYNFSKFGRIVNQNSPNKKFKTFKSLKREIRSNSSSRENSPLGKYDIQEKKQVFNVQPQLYHIKQARNKINQIRGSASKSPSNRSSLKSKLALEKIRLSQDLSKFRIKNPHLENIQHKFQFSPLKYY